MGGCGVTPARQVNPKTKPFEIPTLHHCQHCPLPAGAWHGPSTSPARPLPTPAVSIWGGTEGYCAEGDSFVFGHSCPGLGQRPTASPAGEREGRGQRGQERMGQHVVGGTRAVRVPSTAIPLEGHSAGMESRSPLSLGWSPHRVHSPPCPAGMGQPGSSILPQFPVVVGGIPLPALGVEWCPGSSLTPGAMGHWLRTLLALTSTDMVHSGGKRDHFVLELALSPRKVITACHPVAVTQPSERWGWWHISAPFMVAGMSLSPPARKEMLLPPASSSSGRASLGWPKIQPRVAKILPGMAKIPLDFSGWEDPLFLLATGAASRGGKWSSAHGCDGFSRDLEGKPSWEGRTGRLSCSWNGSG